MPTKIQQYIDSLKKSGALEDNFVLSKKQRKLILEAFEAKEGLVKIKKSTQLETEVLQHSVIRDTDGQVYAILSKSQKIRLSGVQGTIKIAQNLKTGEFCLVKISRIKDVEKEKYKKEEAEQEPEHLRKISVLKGNQVRSNDKYQYKHYTFIKILPGFDLSHLEDGILKNFSQLQKCTCVLNILLKLKSLQEASIIHRDLHPGNILLDTNTMEVNIIDFGVSVKADKHGFWYGKGVEDINGNGPTIRFANGIDIRRIYRESIYQITSNDKVLNEIWMSLIQASSQKNAAGDDEYNSVDLTASIARVIEYQNKLQSSLSRDLPQPAANRSEEAALLEDGLNLQISQLEVDKKLERAKQKKALVTPILFSEGSSSGDRLHQESLAFEDQLLAILKNIKSMRPEDELETKQKMEDEIKKLTSLQKKAEFTLNYSLSSTGKKVSQEIEDALSDRGIYRARVLDLFPRQKPKIS